MKTTTVSLLLCLCCVFGYTQSVWYPRVSEEWDWESMPAVPQSPPAQWWWWWWQNAQRQPVNQVPPKPTTTPKPPTACHFTTPKPKPCMKPCQYGSYFDGCNQCRCANYSSKNPVDISINNHK